MTRPKHIPPKKTGRPYISDYDQMSKVCLVCGNAFFLRDKANQSMSKFLKRKFCSKECSLITYLDERLNPKDWILNRVDIVYSGCWEWKLRRTSKGYGMTHRSGINIRAHRYSYEAWNGPIPKGALILHSCDNPPCCNPEHLRAGTAQENRDDAIARGRAAHQKKDGVA